MQYDTFMDIVTKRRSTRSFDDKPVSREDIEKMIKVATMAPSGFNSQPWQFVVVDDLKIKDQIAQDLVQTMGQAKSSRGFIEAPVYILLYGDSMIREKAPPAKKDDDEWWEFTFKISLANAFMTLQYAATSLGLGTMWVSSFRTKEVDDHAKEMLNIPKSYELFEMLAVGYPKNPPTVKKVKPIESVIQYNAL